MKGYFETLFCYFRFLELRSVRADTGRWVRAVFLCLFSFKDHTFVVILIYKLMLLGKVTHMQFQSKAEHS